METKPKAKRGPKPKTPEIVLTDAHKDVIRALWDKESLDVVAQKAFSNPALTLNSLETNAVRTFIASMGEPRVEQKPKIEKMNELTPELKANINALMEREEPPSVKEVVEMLFGVIPDLSPLHWQYRLVHEYIKFVREDAVDMWDEPVKTRRYTPPQKFSSMIGMCNRYVINPNDSNKALYDQATMKKAQENNLRALLGHMNNAHFITRASLYQRQADRNLFESTFVRHLHDKAADLTQEEVDIYITIAVEVVRVSQFDRDIALQERLRNNILETAGADENKVKLSMSLVESINTMMTKRDSSSKLVHTLVNSVAGERSKRINSRSGGTDSLVTLINLWIDEQSRMDLIALAKKEKEEDEKEFGRIASLDDAIALMAGLSREEAMM